MFTVGVELGIVANATAPPAAIATAAAATDRVTVSFFVVMPGVFPTAAGVLRHAP
jgi:hypothetical protein